MKLEDIGELFFFNENTFINKDAKKSKRKFLSFILPLLRAFCIYLIVIASILVLIPSTSAMFVTPTEIGTTYIEWNMSRTVNYIAVDGVTVTDWNLNCTCYIASNLEPNSKHSIYVENFEIGRDAYNTAYTLPLEETSFNSFWAFVMQYILLFVSILLMCVAARVPLIGMVAFLFAFIGLLSALIQTDFYIIMMFSSVLIGTTCITYVGVKK